VNAPVPQAAATQSGAAKQPARTAYVVLVQVDDDGWREAPDTVEAASATAAVKRYLADNESARSAAAYVAVPARSWQPLKQQTTTKTITTLEAMS
jgi:hypothetical protein